MKFVPKNLGVVDHGVLVFLCALCPRLLFPLQRLPRLKLLLVLLPPFVPFL